MTPLSTRYAVPLLVLLALALVPVMFHSYRTSHYEDCANPGALLEPREGTIELEGSRVLQLHFRIYRSFEPKYLYMRPAANLAERFRTDGRKLKWIDAGDEKLPVYMLYEHSGRAIRLAAYTFVYNSRPVAHPFVAQLTSSLTQLFEGTRPLTLFLISGRASRDRLGAMEAAAEEWLIASWNRYRSVCSE